MFLDTSQQSILDNEGYLVLDAAISAESLEAIGRRLSDHLDTHGYSDPGVPVTAADAVIAASPEVETLLAESGISLAALRSDQGLTLSSDQVVRKRSGHFNAPWHQDSEALSGRGALTIYVSLDDASEGAMQVIPRSQQGGARPHERKILIDQDSFQDEAVVVSMAAGTVMLLHPHTVHRGMPNTRGAPTTSYTLILQHND